MPSDLMNDCQRFSVELSEVADGGECLDPSAASHFGSCLRCQAELAQYKKLLRALSNLRGQVLRPDEFLLHDILTALNQGAGRRYRLPSLAGRPVQGRSVGAVVATAGAAACTAGAIVLANRLTTRHRLATG